MPARAGMTTCMAFSDFFFNSKAGISMSKARFLMAMTLACWVFATAHAADTYKIDPMHTYPSLEFPHMGLSTWRGKFNKTSGSISLDLAAKKGSVDIVIDADSIDFGLDSMHEHAVKEEWFDVAKYPTAAYKGKLIFTGGKATAVDGELTVKGITKPVKLKINSFVCMTHPYYKKPWCGADAEGDLHWADFGMKKWGEGDADKVTLHIQVEAGREDAGGPVH